MFRAPLRCAPRSLGITALEGVLLRVSLGRVPMEGISGGPQDGAFWMGFPGGGPLEGITLKIPMEGVPSRGHPPLRNL
jgi:hypothetical protein